MRHYYLLACLVIVLPSLMPASAARASVITFGLSNHPDGNQNPPGYGIRLDNIIDFAGSPAPTAIAGVMTLSFDSLNNAFLDYDTSTGKITIRGTAIGGSDNRPTPSDGPPDYKDNHLFGKYEFNMMFPNSSGSIGTGNIEVNLSDGLGSGHVKMVEFKGSAAPSPILNRIIALNGKANGDDLVFQFAKDGHRLDPLKYPDLASDPSIWVGRGWINNAAMAGIRTNDFLFIGRVPEPSGFIVWSLILMGVCISGKQISRFQRTSRFGT